MRRAALALAHLSRKAMAKKSSSSISTSTSFPSHQRTPPIHWILDWDSTLTQRDTLSALVHIAATKKPTSNILESWNHITQAYATDYTSTLSKLSTALSTDPAQQQEIPRTLDAERALSKQLEAVEHRSIQRVSDSGIFAGLTAQDIDVGARRAVERGDVRLRDGAGDFLVRELEGERGRERERDKGGGNGEGDRRIGRIDIISVNWSQRFIASSLEAAVPALQGRTCCAPSYSYDGSKPAPVHSQTATDHNNAPTSNSISVFANELSGLASNHPSTGILCAPSSPRIITSLDKLAHLQNLRNLSPATDMPLVYVGDSRTDLECLLAADDGICMRDEPMGSSQRELRDVVAGLGFACVHVGEWRADGAGGGRKVVGWARDFREIEDWARERWKWK